MIACNERHPAAPADSVAGKSWKSMPGYAA